MTDSRSCAICGSSTVFAFEVNRIALVDCTLCSHRQADLSVDQSHVDSTYADEYFTGGGAGYEDYTSEGAMLVTRGAKYGRLLTKHRRAGRTGSGPSDSHARHSIEPQLGLDPSDSHARHSIEPPRVLDIGAAAGYLAEGMSQSGWSAVGVEPNDTMASLGRQRGIDVRTGSAEELLTRMRASQPESWFDAVAMIQVIAHLGDPLTVLETAAQLLHPGGLLLVETWDRASISAKVFGKKWHEYSPPSVVHWFTRSELDSVVARKGFIQVDSGRYPKMITAAHGRQLVEHRMGEQHIATKLARKIPAGLKVPYPGDDLFWTIYRQVGK
jgi:SAM-dependent methyltransferase